METMFLIQTKVGSTPVTCRKFVDLPGTNVMRGLSGLALKSPEEHHIFVTKPTAEMICKNMGSAVDVPEAEEDGDVDAGEESQGSPLWPFSSGIDLCREMLNLYSTGPTALVNFTAGFGQWELACLHDGVTCSSFVTGVKHREAGPNWAQWELLKKHRIYIAYIRCNEGLTVLARPMLLTQGQVVPAVFLFPQKMLPQGSHPADSGADGDQHFERVH